MTERRLEADLRLVTINFNEDMQWEQNINTSDYTIGVFADSEEILKSEFGPDSSRSLTDMEGLNKIISVEIVQVKLRGNNLRISLKFKETVKNATLALIFRRKFMLQKANDPSVAIDVRILTTADINFIFTDMDIAMENAKTAAHTAVTAITALLFILSIPQALVLMKVFQTIDYYIYIDCEYPTNFSKFLEMINKNLVDMLPNIFKFMIDDEGKPLYSRFELFGLQVHFLANVGVQISLILLTAILKLIMKASTKAFPRVELIKSRLV